MDWREFQALQKVVELDSRFISYVEQGEGQPVVLLHGIPTWGYLWHRLIPALAKKHRVLAPDLLGFGYSDKSDRFDRSIRYQAEMIAGWLQSEGIAKAAVVGHDIGGGVALRLAVFFPELVSRLVLMNCVCYDSWPIEMMLQLGNPETYHRVSASAAASLLKQGIKKGFSTPPEDEVIDGLLAPYVTEVGKLSLVRNAVALNTNLTTELTPLLPKLETRTLVLWGEEDSFQPIKYAEHLAWDIPKTRLATIKNARHFVMWDSPEEVEGHLLVFLEG